MMILLFVLAILLLLGLGVAIIYFNLRAERAEKRAAALFEELHTLASLIVDDYRHARNLRRDTLGELAARAATTSPVFKKMVGDAANWERVPTGRVP